MLTQCAENIFFNLNECVNEIKFTLDLSGHTVYYKVLPELDPADFSSYEDLFATVQSQFNELFLEMYANQTKIH